MLAGHPNPPQLLPEPSKARCPRQPGQDPQRAELLRAPEGATGLRSPSAGADCLATPWFAGGVTDALKMYILERPQGWQRVGCHSSPAEDGVKAEDALRAGLLSHPEGKVMLVTSTSWGKHRRGQETSGTPLCKGPASLPTPNGTPERAPERAEPPAQPTQVFQGKWKGAQTHHASPRPLLSQCGRAAPESRVRAKADGCPCILFLTIFLFFCRYASDAATGVS